MLIKTTIDVSEGLALCDLILKKVPYATSNSLTRTAKEVIEAERSELKNEFQVRKQFILNLVKITKYPRPGDLWVRVAIDTSRAQGGQVLLSIFEEGGEKTPEKGPEIAVPITGGKARPSWANKVRASLQYTNLHLQQHITANGKVQYKGDSRSFVIPGLGVFVRTSANKKRQAKRRQKSIEENQSWVTPGGKTVYESTDTVMLYKFLPEAHLKQQMHFVKTARELVLKRFGEIWREEFVKELAGRARR